jgi:hypothetical protein
VFGDAFFPPLSLLCSQDNIETFFFFSIFLSFYSSVVVAHFALAKLFDNLLYSSKPHQLQKFCLFSFTGFRRQVLVVKFCQKYGDIFVTSLLRNNFCFCADV